MSLPPTQKSRSVNPDQNTVASPSDPASIERDVGRKLRIYGVVQALRQGRLPDNRQLDEALAFLRDSILPEAKGTSGSGASQGTKALNGENIAALSDEGRTVVLDVRDIVETTRQLLKQKNTDDVLQEFVYHTSGINLSSASRSGVELPVSVEEARKDGETAVHHLRALLQLLLTNREARKLLNDSKLILRDLFAQTAVAAAQRARPSAKEMNGLDDAAPAQDWAGSLDDGEGDDEAVESNGDHMEGGRESGDERERQQVHHAMSSDGTGNTVEKGDGAQSLEPQDVNGDHPKADDQKKALSLNFKDRFRSLAGRVPEQHRARAKQEYTGAKAYLQEEFPQERRDQFIWRLKKVVNECQATDSYQASISWFFTILHTYFSNARSLATSHASQTNDLFAGDPLLVRAVSELRMIAERGAGGKSLDGVLHAIDVLWNDALEDEEMRKWWNSVEGFVRKTLLQPGYITSTQFTSQSRKLRASGRFFFAQKYKTHTDTLVDAAQAWSRAWLDDPLHVRFSDNWAKLVRDLLFDEKGGLVFKSPLWKDMRTVILPGLVHKIGVIPIPRIEYVDEDLDLVIENLTLQGANLFPKVIEVKAQHYSKLSPFASVKDEHSNSLTLIFSGIQADMRDVAFYFRKKRGLKIKDEGLADVVVGGRGITIKVKLTSTNSEGQKDGAKSVFTVKDVDVKVEELKFAIRESKHDFLYKTLRPIATRLIKKQIAKVFSDGIRTALEYADEQLAAAREGMAAAQTSEDGSKREVLRELWHKQSSEISSIKSNRGSTFRVVPKRESMLLSDKGHRKGWIRRQAQKGAEAVEGEGWRSEAFDMAPFNEGVS